MKQSKTSFFFFWGAPFSQWGNHPMVIDDIRYSTCIQYLMAERARLFGDSEMVRRIMSTPDPEEQHNYGTRVRGFDQTVWDQRVADIAYKANLAKYTQNESAAELLIRTGYKIIAETSPDDLVWGIGLHENDPRVCDPALWPGANLLGETLMKVRTELLITAPSSSRARKRLATAMTACI